MKTNPSNPTLKQVAQRCGLSVPSVKQVLSGRGGAYREATRAKVLAAAQALGYRPNAAARAVSTGRFGAVGLITSTRAAEGGLATPVIWAMAGELAAHDLHLVVGPVADQTLTDAGGVPKVLREWAVDGLLISYTSNFPPQLLELIHRHRIPAVWMNVKLPTDCVRPDDAGALAGATADLIARGHRRIALVSYRPHPVHYSFPDRCEGYVQVMRQAGLRPRLVRGGIEVAGDTPELDHLRQWLRSKDRPTAVLIEHEFSAGNLIYAAEQLGLSVPGDLSVVAIEHRPVRVLGRAVQTLQIPFEPMSVEAVRMLREKMAHPNKPLPTRVLPFVEHEGQTLAGR